MANVKLCKTKAGKGFKVVVGEEWFYTSIPEMMRLIEGVANACTFRSIEDEEEENHPDNQGDSAFVDESNDSEFCPLQDTGMIGDLHAWQEYSLQTDKETTQQPSRIRKYEVIVEYHEKDTISLIVEAFSKDEALQKAMDFDCLDVEYDYIVGDEKVRYLWENAQIMEA